MKITWIPWEKNEIEDKISKLIDLNDWQLTEKKFKFQNRKWGHFSVHRFARKRKILRPEDSIQS